MAFAGTLTYLTRGANNDGSSLSDVSSGERAVWEVVDTAAPSPIVASKSSFFSSTSSSSVLVEVTISVVGTGLGTCMERFSGSGRSISSISWTTVGVAVVELVAVALLEDRLRRWVVAPPWGFRLVGWMLPGSEELAPPMELVSMVPLSASELARDKRWFRLPVLEENSLWFSFYANRSHRRSVCTFVTRFSSCSHRPGQHLVSQPSGD